MRFYCQCLNVTIDVLDTLDDQQTLAHVIPPDLTLLLNNTSVNWRVCTVSSEKTAHVAWESLFHSIAGRDMKLNRCLACQQYTHVTNMDSNRILINRDLLDATTINTAYLDPHYSELAKIVLPTVTTARATASYQGDSFRNERELIQQMYRQAVEDAERENEEKIRIFQREQEEYLQNKTATLNKELNTFLSFIRSIARCPSNAKTSPILQTSSSYINENSMESGFGSDIFDSSATDYSRHSSTIERTLSERASYPDDDDDDDADDDSVLDANRWATHHGDIFQFATSLPKEIAFRSVSTPQQGGGHDGSHGLERIAESFRELSQSLMCTDGTELFGELPSPRLNVRHT